MANASCFSKPLIAHAMCIGGEPSKVTYALAPASNNAFKHPIEP